MEQISQDRFWNRLLNEVAREGVSDLVVNGPDSVFLNVNGVSEKITVDRMTEQAYRDSIKEGLAKYVTTVEEYDENEYIFEGRLRINVGKVRYDSRCHIATSPISDLPLVTIAKKAASTTTIDELAASGSMSTDMLQFLKAAVKSNLTIVLSGPSGAGKTTTLEALTRLFDPSDRIGIAEDVPELTPQHQNVAPLHTHPWKPGRDQNRVADLSFVVKQFMRMRPSKVLVGETRGKEFADFLVAANAGMKGSMTTIHADDPISALDKMTRFALAGSDNQSLKSVNHEIASAVDIIVQLGKSRGRRRVTHIYEVTRTVAEDESARITTAKLWEWDRATDEFVKHESPTDILRDAFEEANQDIKNIISTSANTRSSKHTPAATMTSGGPLQAGPNGPRIVGSAPQNQNPLSGSGGGRRIL